jgi:hypothetical protein
MKTKLTFAIMTIAAIIVSNLQIASAQPNSMPYWSTDGNSNSNVTSKLGTTIKEPLRLTTNNSVRLYIHATTGNVGIGSGSTASSNYRLQVIGASYGIYGSGSSFGVVGSGGTYGVYGSGSTYGVYGSGSTYGVVGSGGAYGVYGSGSTYGVYGTTSGYAGVYGSSSTSYGVVGNTERSDKFYAGVFFGYVYSSNGYVTSDQRLKQNIEDFSSAMDIINKLHPRQYDFRHDGNYKYMNLPEGRHYGLVAQDVEKILPNLVRETKFDLSFIKPQNAKGSADANQNLSETNKNSSETVDCKALNYIELIPIMIKGMQEQQKQIEELKQEIASLKASNASSSPLTSAYLKQNAPNPFSNNTIIQSYVPADAHQAQLLIYSSDGRQLKSYSLTNNGMNNVTISSGTLASGQYIYSLIIDGRKVDTKNMILTK